LVGWSDSAKSGEGLVGLTAGEAMKKLSRVSMEAATYLIVTVSKFDLDQGWKNLGLKTFLGF